MKTLGAQFSAHLSGDATTLCRCWRLSRADGTVLGFTDHDRDLTFDGTTFKAAAGFAAGDVEAGLGLAVSSASVVGALSSDALSEADLAAGLYDGAVIEVFIVNWQDASQNLLSETRQLGEVRLSGGAFEAELLGVAHKLDARQGRIYSRRCDALLGDARCKADLSVSGMVLAVSIAALLDETRLVVSVPNTISPGFFRHGRLELTSGARVGTTLDIASHRHSAAGQDITLWQLVPAGLVPGDQANLVAGCDKSFSTCREKFSNELNFQGFPHLPGPDFAYGVIHAEGTHDGRKLFD